MLAYNESEVEINKRNPSFFEILLVLLLILQVTISLVLVFQNKKLFDKLDSVIFNNSKGGEIIDNTNPDYYADISYDEQNPHIGAINGTIKIIIFTDYQCPYCKDVTKILKGISNQYSEQVLVVFRDFPLDSHQFGKELAYLAHCSYNRGHYEPFLIALESLDLSVITEESLMNSMKGLGLAEEEILDCVQDAQIWKEVDEEINFARQLDIKSVPTIFVNGFKLVGPSEIEIRTLVEKLIEE